MVWANFLHFYQPPTQKKYWVDRVTDESYRRLVCELLANPAVKLTLNVNSVLCDLWRQYGHEDVIKGIKTLVTRGQIELTGSAKFHPLLPKMPRDEIRRQIILNEQGLFNYFCVLPPVSRISTDLIPIHTDTDTTDPRKSVKKIRENLSAEPPRLKGFFPPEMAYDRYVAAVVAEMGYEWILAEELSYSPKLGQVKYDRVCEVGGIYTDSGGGFTRISENPPKIRENSEDPKKPLLIFFRERGFSWKVLAGQLGTPSLFLTELGSRLNNNEYLLTAMDGETFGHHRPGMEKQLFEIYRGVSNQVKSCTISELPGLFPKREAVQTLPSTWALMEHEAGKPFARWDDPDNEIQVLQWELTTLAIKAVNSAHPNLSKLNPNDPNIDYSDNSETVRINSDEARGLLDRALHSDQFWWASARPWWSLEMIERGARELLSSIEATDASVDVKNKARDLYFKIITTGFEWQRTGKVDELSKIEDESVRMLTDRGLPQLPATEIDKMVAVIRAELDTVVQNGEYERAIQLRDRIKELTSYKQK